MTGADRTEPALTSGDLKVAVEDRGGALRFVEWRGIQVLVPAGGPKNEAACFPLVPFGNRISANRFDFRGRSHSLAPNTVDPLVLHGDGWLMDWELEQAKDTDIELRLSRAASESSPYAYDAVQRVSLEEDCLSLALDVTNRGDTALPFGIGFHPFFRRTADMTVQMHALAMWSEGKGHLPETCGKVPIDLDFSDPRPVPLRWINNAFEGFGGEARLHWPDIDLEVTLRCDPVFDVMMIHAAPEEANAGVPDFVCLEPMSHLPNAHNMPDLGGLSILEPGDNLTGTITFTFRKSRKPAEETHD
ncbi:aldose 1-epimerase [Rhodobacterales bacterium]|nr:aldose 1-epimerase [Rhodobacterales bacterium]